MCCQVLRLDNVGRGYSECRGLHQLHTPQLFATQIRQLLAHLNLSSRCVNLVGYSMGAAIVAEYVRMFGGRRPAQQRTIGKVVLVAAAGMDEVSPPAMMGVPVLSCVLMKLLFLRGMTSSTTTDFVDATSSAARSMSDSLFERARNEPGLTRAAVNTARNFPLGGQGMRSAYQVHRPIVLRVLILL